MKNKEHRHLYRKHESTQLRDYHLVLIEKQMCICGRVRKAIYTVITRRGWDDKRSDRLKAIEDEILKEGVDELDYESEN